MGNRNRDCDSDDSRSRASSRSGKSSSWGGSGSECTEESTECSESERSGSGSEWSGSSSRSGRGRRGGGADCGCCCGIGYLIIGILVILAIIYFIFFGVHDNVKIYTKPFGPEDSFDGRDHCFGGANSAVKVLESSECTNEVAMIRLETDINGITKIHPRSDMNKCWQNTGNDQVTLGTCTGSSKQNWRITRKHGEDDSIRSADADQDEGNDLCILPRGSGFIDNIISTSTSIAALGPCSSQRQLLPLARLDIQPCRFGVLC